MNSTQELGNDVSITFKTDSNAGLFSNFNRIITILNESSHVKRVKWDIYGQNSGCMGYDNSGELFSSVFEDFDESNELPLIEYISYNWGVYKPVRITGMEAIDYYMNRDKLLPFNKIFKKYFKLKPHIQSIMENEIKKIRNGSDLLIGLVVRSTPLKDEQPKGRMPTRDEYEYVIDNIPGDKYNRYFLCVDNHEDLNFYKSKLSNSYHTNIRRSDTCNDIEPHKKTRGTWNDFLDSLLEVYYLASCDAIIHCVSNMATASLYMNMNQISIPII
jgi:hypothetical protein